MAKDLGLKDMNTINGRAGSLFIVGTPIGNLKDITFRAVDVLKSIDIIVAEDTRRTKKLLNRLDLSKSITSYHDFNKQKKTPEIIERLLSGQDVALVSDAGIPGISDPGYYLIREALKKGIGIIPVPGVSAVLTALSVSGLPTDRFVFEGFLNARGTKREKQLRGLINEERTIIMFESPFRLIKGLEAILKIMGNRQICVAREMTKVFEEFVRGDVETVLSAYRERSGIKGEITLVIQGKGKRDKES